MAHIDRKLYWRIFIWLFVLTVLEVGLVFVPGISKGLLILALCGLAVTKASLVGWHFMHLSHETRELQLTVAIPMLTPAFYAVVLVAEGAWRYLG